MTNDN